MKNGPIRRLLVRLIGQPATSVPPKTEPFEAFIKQTLRGILPPPDYELGGKVIGFSQPEAGSEPATSQPQAGVKPPSDPPTEGWSFTKWAEVIEAEGHFPGWAYGRFANQVTKLDGKDAANFVFGFVRSAFGVHRTPFDICFSDGLRTTMRQDVLTVITHLRSGYMIGLFSERAVAIEAAELAERVHPGWQTDSKPTKEGIDRSMQAWDGAGICAAIDAHAHRGDGTTLQINGRSMESIMDGKPERLS